MTTTIKTMLCLVASLAMGLVTEESAAEDGKMLKKAGNGVEVDISRPYYDSDPTVIQEKLKIVVFKGGFGIFEGGQNYAKAFGAESSMM